MPPCLAQVPKLLIGRHLAVRNSSGDILKTASATSLHDSRKFNKSSYEKLNDVGNLIAVVAWVLEACIAGSTMPDEKKVVALETDGRLSPPEESFGEGGPFYRQVLQRLQFHVPAQDDGHKVKRGEEALNISWLKQKEVSDTCPESQTLDKLEIFQQNQMAYRAQRLVQESAHVVSRK